MSHDRSAIRLPIFGQRAIDMRIRELTDDPDFGTFMYEEERRMFRMRDAAPWVFGPLGEFIDTWEDPHRISIDEVWTLFAHFVGLDKNGNPTGCGGVCRYCEDQCDSGVRKNAREAFDVFGLIEQKFIHRRLNSSGIRVRYKDLPHKCHLDLDSVSMPDTPGIYFLLADPENVKIGMSSKSIRHRVRFLQTAHYHELRMVATIPGGKVEEKELHSRFEQYHIRGEWFRLEGELLRFILSMRSETLRVQRRRS